MIKSVRCLNDINQVWSLTTRFLGMLEKQIFQNMYPFPEAFFATSRTMDILKWCSVLMKGVHCEQAFTKSENNKTELMIRPVMNSQKQQCALCAAHWLSRYHIGLVEAGQPPKQHSGAIHVLHLETEGVGCQCLAEHQVKQTIPLKNSQNIGLVFCGMWRTKHVSD